MPIDLDAEFDMQESTPEDVAPQETAPEPEAQPAVDVAVEDMEFEPSWFEEVQSAMANPVIPGITAPPTMPQPPHGYGPPPGYFQPPQQYQPPQQAQPRDPKLNDLDAMFDNPRNFVANIMNQGINQYQQVNQYQTQAEIARVKHANAQNAMYNAKQSIDRGYREVLNKDNSFRSNPAVRNIVDNTLKNLSMRAANAAYNGDYSMARNFDDPKFYSALAAAARQLAGEKGVSSTPAVPHGAVGERVSQRQDDSARVKLPPDLEEVARSVGNPAFRKQLEEEYATAVRLGDLTW